ncbi:MAG: glycosyltransferase family 2 protein, partial [Candidatus Cloacimonetes bacterium]|nr:glycosyltransferase family 2 protein [Candidatus Cloacimonadota bacterium]
MKNNNSNISVVIPVYNNADFLSELIRRLINILDEICKEFELIFVDDGSSDNSLKILYDFQKRFVQIRVIKLLKNYGQSNAIAAGLEFAKYDIMAIMDADLQDKPEDIPKLLERMLLEKSEMAIAQWKINEGCYHESIFSKIFYFASEYLTRIHQPPCTGIFRLITRDAFDKA